MLDLKGGDEQRRKEENEWDDVNDKDDIDSVIDKKVKVIRLIAICIVVSLHPPMPKGACIVTACNFSFRRGQSNFCWRLSPNLVKKFKSKKRKKTETQPKEGQKQHTCGTFT